MIEVVPILRVADAEWSDDVREIELADPDGNRLRIGQSRL